MSSYLTNPNFPLIEYENCPDFLSRFLNYVRINNGRKPHTQISTMLTLREFCQFVHFRATMHEIPPTPDAHRDMEIETMTINELTEVSREDIRIFITFLDEVAHNIPSTIYKKIGCVHRLYDYLILIQEELGISFPSGNPTADSIRPPGRTEQNAEPVLSVAQFKRLLTGVSGKTAVRDRALLLLFCTTGITLSEAAALNHRDITDNEWLLIAGTFPRYVYLTEPCQLAIQQYLTLLREENGNLPSETPLFCSSEIRFRRLTSRTIRNIVVNAGIRSGMGAKITPRLLRQSFRDLLLSYTAGTGDAVAIEYLGYKLNNVQRIKAFYRAVKNELAKQAISASPIALLGSDEGGEA